MDVSISQICAPALCTGGRWYKISPCTVLRTATMGIFCVMFGKYAFPARYYQSVPEIPGQKAIVLLTAAAAGPACMVSVLAIAHRMVGAHVESAPETLGSGERACFVVPDLAGPSPLRADVPAPWSGGAKMATLDCALPPVAVTDATVARARLELDALESGDPAAARPAAPKRAYPRRMPPAKRAPAPAHAAVPGIAPTADPDYARALHVLLHGNPAAAAMICDAALPAAVNLACAIDFVEAAGGTVTARHPQDAALALPSAAFTPDRQFLLDWALRRHARMTAPPAAPAPPAEPAPAPPAAPPIELPECAPPAAPATPEPTEDDGEPPAPELKFRTGAAIAIRAHDDHFRVAVCIQFQNKATHVLARSLTAEDVARITGRPIPAGTSAFNVMYTVAFLMVCAYAAERPTMGFTLWTKWQIPDVELGPYALRDLAIIAPNLRVVATDVLSASPKVEARAAAAYAIALREARAVSSATKRPWGSDEWELRFLAHRD